MVHPATPDAAAPASAAGRLSFDQRIVLVTVVPMVVFAALRLAGGAPPVLAALALFLGGPHVLATLGMYADREIAAIARGDLWRFVTGPLLVIPAVAIGFGLTTGNLALWLLTALLAWQTYHFTKQNLGMFAFWCRGRRLPSMDAFERRYLKATALVGIAGIVRAMDVVPAWNGALQAFGAALMVVGAVVVTVRLRGPRRWALLLATVFFAPVIVANVDVLGASFIYQSAHGAQYYLMVGHTIRADRKAVRLTIPVVLCGGAALLFITSPDAFTTTPWLFGLGKGIVAAHFVADASLWRLGNPKVRAVMKERFAFL